MLPLFFDEPASPVIVYKYIGIVRSKKGGINTSLTLKGTMQKGPKDKVQKDEEQKFKSPPRDDEHHERQDIAGLQPQTTGVQFPVLDGEQRLRYPFLAGIEPYMQHIRGHDAKSTIASKQRLIKHIASIFETMKKQDPSVHTNPKEIDELDISKFREWMDTGKAPLTKIIDSGTQKKYLQILQGFLVFHGNCVIVNLKMLHKHTWPREVLKPIKVLSRQDIKKIINTANQIGGWWGEVARIVCLLYIITGVRPSELREADLKDMNINTWIFTISRPKGRGRYGRPRDYKIEDDYQVFILRYLQARAKYLADHNAQSDKLFPYIYYNTHTSEWSEGLWTQLKQLIVETSGVNFTWKNFRSTWYEIQVEDYNVTMQDAATLAGHSLATAERFYHQIGMGKAQSLAGAAFSEAKRRGQALLFDEPDGKVKIWNGPNGI